MWIYDNVQEVTAAPYSEYTAAIEQRKADNIVALEEAVADLSLAMSTDTIDANALSSAGNGNPQVTNRVNLRAVRATSHI